MRRLRALRGAEVGSGGGAGFTALGAWALTSRRGPFLYLTIALFSVGPFRSVRSVTVLARPRVGAGGCFGLALRRPLCVVAGGCVGSALLGRWVRGRLGGRGLRRCVAGSRGSRDEQIVMAIVAPVEVGAGGAVPHFNRVVVRSVDNDGVMAAACEHVGVLFVAPFSVRA